MNNKESIQHNVDKIYQRVGEFIISYQWIEQRMREIGWLIIDPHRESWPPRQLRTLSNANLLKEVEKLYTNLMTKMNNGLSKNLVIDFKGIIMSLNEVRQYRNDMMHSAYFEIKSGDEVLDLVKSNPKLIVDSETGKVLSKTQKLSVTDIEESMKQLGYLAMGVNRFYIQLIHLIPFETHFDKKKHEEI